MLHKLQNSPHHIKARWVWIISAILFAIVFTIWLMAFPSMVAIAPPGTAENPHPAPQRSGLASMFHIFNK